MKIICFRIKKGIIKIAVFFDTYKKLYVVFIAVAMLITKLTHKHVFTHTHACIISEIGTTLVIEW